MTDNMSGLLARTQIIIQKLTLFLIIGAAILLVGLTLAASFGVLPWLEVPISLAGQPVEKAGMFVQIGVTLLLVALMFFLPSNARIMRLETSHRKFRVRMEDVAKAYRVAHEDDRKKLFRIGSEFDSVRDRLLHLRDHPDLGALEPEILELAAQMSHEARKLADIYDDDKVERARIFLKQRQQEVEKVQETLSLARKNVDDLRRWTLQVETEETIVAGQIATLKNDLFDLLPVLGYEIENEPDNGAGDDEIVVPIATRPKAKKTSKSDRR